MRGKKGLKFVSAAIVASLMAWSLPLRGIPQSGDGVASAQGPAEYDIEDIQGQVQVLEDGAKDWEPAEEGQVVESGDEIKVGDDSQATLMMQSDTSVQLSAGADMKVDQIESNASGGFLSRLEVFAGNVLADVKKHLDESHSSFEIDSDGVVCGVRGTAFSVNSQDNAAQVSTFEGAVNVGNGTESRMVQAGSMSEFRAGRFFRQRRLEGRELQRFQRWRAFRQTVVRKRMRRLAEVRLHRRAAWVRKHPHPGKGLWQKKRKKRKLRQLERRDDR